MATSEKTSDHLRIVTLIDDAGNIQTIRTTDEHPFYAPGMGWTSAKDLEGGQQLATADSTRTLTVLSNIREEHAAGVKVYNFTVADNHTYFVTDAPTRGPPSAAWVHNVCTPASLLRNSQGRYSPAIYSVYKGFDASGRLVYVGITTDVGRRAVEHAARFKVPGAIVGNLTKRQARAIEQALISKYGLSTQGGQLLNKVNSIASNRKWFADAKSWGNAMVRLKGW